MSTYDDTEGRADRIHDLKKTLSKSLEERTSTNAYPWQAEDDIYVEGYLSEIIEWAQDWRSEIEELA